MVEPEDEREAAKGNPMERNIIRIEFPNLVDHPNAEEAKVMLKKMYEATAYASGFFLMTIDQYGDLSMTSYGVHPNSLAQISQAIMRKLQTDHPQFNRFGLQFGEPVLL